MRHFFHLFNKGSKSSVQQILHRCRNVGMMESLQVRGTHLQHFPEWWISMDAGIVDGRIPRMIRKVPEVFRQKESCKGCFDPMVVSIGPYHHGSCDLQDMERLKYSMARQFIEDCHREFSNIYIAVEGICGDARQFYPDEEKVSSFDDNKFTTLMLVDGCFVLQFIISFMNNNHIVKHMKSNIAAFVRRDLMLLENQLPYIVLKKLMSLRFPGNDGEDLISNFISSFRGGLPPQTTDKQANLANNMHPPLHLLDIFLSKYIHKEDPGSKSSGNKYINKEDPGSESSGNKYHHWFSYSAAKELRTRGIDFRPSAGEHFNDIVFESTLTAGWLFLPKIMIDDTTKSLLLNLVAYEASPDAPDNLCCLASYICFMDSLIDQAEDVKVLRSKGIVFNLLGNDQQAAELFNDIAQGLAPKHYAFCGIRKRIDLHSRCGIRTWMAEWIHAHFSRPWTFIAFIGATATIFMTFLQTYVSVKGYYSGKGR